MAQQRETPMMRATWKALSRGPVRLYRNNVGLGWQGQTTHVTAETLADCRASLRPGDMIIRGPRPLRAGLDRGSGDHIGWRQVVITPAMAGHTIAQFVSAEAKAAWGRERPEQVTWRQLVSSRGGLAFTYRSTEEAAAALRSPIADFL